MSNIFFIAFKTWKQKNRVEALKLINDHFKNKFGKKAFLDEDITSVCEWFDESDPADNLDRFDVEVRNFAPDKLELPFGIVFCELWELSLDTQLLFKLIYCDPYDLVYEPFAEDLEDVMEGHQLHLIPPLLVKYAQKGLISCELGANVGVATLHRRNIEEMDEDFEPLKSMLLEQLAPVLEARPANAWQLLVDENPLQVLQIFLRDHFLLAYDNIPTERWAIQHKQHPDYVKAVLDSLVYAIEKHKNNTQLTEMVQLDGGFYGVTDGRTWLKGLHKDLSNEAFTQNL
ncbi:hypothetical protein [Microscilla marina]|uniref:Uncharacterized protein n=1 Tax=Microscilla marina ATCC 23134 TaxID=313606 RepID=A2A0J4_MICM2|nr:hypothetical protein [Microscilla marina]EAY23843.1 hypothetical protein M23134_00922 [Microscilla marina ATCC 23134]